MAHPAVICSTSGARLVAGEKDVVLFGQPPEVLKALLLSEVSEFNSLVLTDIREKGGSLTNNLEFPLYFFLFYANAHARGERLNLIGDEAAISHAIRVLRLTLTGPVAAELDAWGTDPELKKEWLEVADTLAYKDDDGDAVKVEDFFQLRPFRDGKVKLAEMEIMHTGLDQYEVRSGTESLAIDLSRDLDLEPPYPVQRDYVPGGLVRLGLEVLGGASGFTPDEPCTGLALCHNGDYILIDAMPFLDQHLVARGISKNQISALFLTHLHDDHCTMFPLMLMPHVVEIITTKEIFNMAMDKLSCALGWTLAAVKEHFKLFEIEPGVPANYYGLLIEPHLTVHSIPTIGATFSVVHQGRARQICIIGDNHSMTAIRDLHEKGMVRDTTFETLRRLYRDRFSLLVADGGAGAIHGDPADAIKSESERVVYVHVEELSNEFDTTFSLAESGKRYTIVEGDPALYSGQINHYLTEWLDRPISHRWLSSLLAESEIRRYNSDDVILVQGAEGTDYVYLLLTGYCDVVHHDGKGLQTLAQLQAGDTIGEMAAITGTGARNASVVARTPVTVCAFSAQMFTSFVSANGMAEMLRERWSLRPIIKTLPCFAEITSNVLLQTCMLATKISLASGEDLATGDSGWFLLAEGSVRNDQGSIFSLDPSELVEFGWCPYAGLQETHISAVTDAELVYFARQQFSERLLAVPQLNYYLRKFRSASTSTPADWQLGVVPPR